MGKIDKEKLLKELPCSDTPCIGKLCKHFVLIENVSKCIINKIKNFPEEPEIDFDALLEEYEGEVNRKSFVAFLKSKRLTAPKSFELPVKKTWKMKPEHVQLYKDFGFDNVRHWSLDVPPSSKVEKYYDPHEEPDYSAIPKGSIVEFIYNHQKKVGYAEKVSSDGIYVNVDNQKIKTSDIVRVVEMAKECV